MTGTPRRATKAAKAVTRELAPLVDREPPTVATPDDPWAALSAPSYPDPEAPDGYSRDENDYAADTASQLEAQAEAPQEPGPAGPWRLVVALPSKGRPESVKRTVDAFCDTGAFADGAALFYSVDPMDLHAQEYMAAIQELVPAGHLAGIQVQESTGMAGPTNDIGRTIVGTWDRERWPAVVASMGDDHVPRTSSWVAIMCDALAAMPSATGIAYPDDGHRGEALATSWFMTINVLEATGRIVPCLVNHLFSDNSVMALGTAAGCLRYVPDVLMEHMHPLAGNAPDDAGYRSVNARDAFDRDRTKYRRWLSSDKFGVQVAKVRRLIGAEPLTVGGLSTYRNGAGVIAPR